MYLRFGFWEGLSLRGENLVVLVLVLYILKTEKVLSLLKTNCSHYWKRVLLKWDPSSQLPKHLQPQLITCLRWVLCSCSWQLKNIENAKRTCKRSIISHFRKRMKIWWNFILFDASFTMKWWQLCIYKALLSGWKVSLCEDFTIEKWMISEAVCESSGTINPGWVQVADCWAFSLLLAISASWVFKLMPNLYSIDTCHLCPKKLLVRAYFECNRISFVRVMTNYNCKDKSLLLLSLLQIILI